MGLLATETGFAGAIQRLFQDDNLREECGSNARHVAESHFGWPGLIDRLESFYAELLRSSRA
jgi:glycosyltransferase involved in cell wall biosynthesis